MSTLLTVAAAAGDVLALVPMQIPDPDPIQPPGTEGFNLIMGWAKWVALAVCILGLIMLVVGWNYATTLGGRGFYVSMPWLSRFWMYFPVPLAGVAMIIFEIEALYNHIKSIFVKEEN